MKTEVPVDDIHTLILIEIFLYDAYIYKQTDWFSITTIVSFQNGQLILAFAENYHQAGAKNYKKKNFNKTLLLRMEWRFFSCIYCYRCFMYLKILTFISVCHCVEQTCMNMCKTEITIPFLII